MPQNIPSMIDRSNQDALSLFRRLSSQVVASSFQVQSRDQFGGQVYTRSNTTLDDLSTLLGYNAVASGNRSTALGAFAYAKEDNAIAVGIYAQAWGNESIAIGEQSKATAYRTMAVGVLANSSGLSSVSIGNIALASGLNSVAVGNNATASGTSGVAVGDTATASGASSTAIGRDASALSDGSTAVGTQAEAGFTFSANGSVAFGQNATTDALRSIAIGLQSIVGFNAGDGQYGIAIGAFTDVEHDYAICLGRSAESSAANQLTIGWTSSYITEQRLQVGGNGQFAHVTTSSQLLTIAAAPTTDSTIQIPLNSILKFVSVRTRTAIPTAATYTVTGATTGTVFNTAAVSTAAGSTDKGNAAGAYYNGAAQFIRITPNMAPAAGTGQVRITICYEDVTPPTS